MKYLFTLCFLFYQISSGFTKDILIIPEPVSIEFAGNNSLEIKQIRFKCDDQYAYLIRNFKNQLTLLGCKIDDPIQSSLSKANLILRIDAQFHPDLIEAYKIKIDESKIFITSSTANGLFYGIQSLAQLAVNKPAAKGFEVRLVIVEDYPRFAWRGFMLDESRHFFGKAKVKQLLDWMAFYKLNRFHWHLTDVPGWRLEIKKYTLLATVGGKGNQKEIDAQPMYYTQDEIKEIIRYASERFIEIIPEIDMPGHATAANLAYPEFSGGGSVKYPEFTFNPGKEETYQFLSNILREVAQLFPSQYIHLGGDEVHFGNEQWNSNPSVKAIMEKNNLNSLQEVEYYFTNRMADTLSVLNKKMIGWDEIISAGISRDKALAMWWRHDKPDLLDLGLKKGYHMILCPRIPLYFDFVQNNTHHSGRYWQKDYAPIEKILDFKATYLTQLSKYPGQIEGIQANLWTETVQTPERLDYMTFPRIAALSETAWSKNDRTDLQEFIKRLQPSFRLYKATGVTYFNPENPAETPEIQH